MGLGKVRVKKVNMIKYTECIYKILKELTKVKLTCGVVPVGAQCVHTHLRNTCLCQVLCCAKAPGG